MNDPILKSAILLINLGTPESPTPWGVIKFLRQFLSDRRVVEIPRILWWFILYFLVLPFRSFRVAKAYQMIWMKEGSPLRVLTERLANSISLVLSTRHHHSIPVLNAMTYGSPDIKTQMKILKQLEINRLIILPLFPQYSATTTGAAFDAISRVMNKQRYIPSLIFVHDYGMSQVYLNALAERITQYWNEEGRSERLIFSFHGLPQRTETLGDPYIKSCREMVLQLSKKLKITENSFSIAFQSRFGRAKWATPYLDEILDRWALEGVQSIDIISPSFSVECLETLEELGIRSREKFIKAGGKQLRLIPLLNDSVAHANVLIETILKFL